MVNSRKMVPLVSFLAALRILTEGKPLEQLLYLITTLKLSAFVQEAKPLWNMFLISTSIVFVQQLRLSMLFSQDMDYNVL